MSIFRVTGKAGKVSVREGETNGRNWEMRSQAIEIAPLVTTEVSLPDGDKGFTSGEEVDLAVDVYVSKGYLRTELKGEWPKPEAARRPLASASAAS